MPARVFRTSSNIIHKNISTQHQNDNTNHFNLTLRQHIHGEDASCSRTALHSRQDERRKRGGNKCDGISLMFTLPLSVNLSTDLLRRARP